MIEKYDASQSAYRDPEKVLLLDLDGVLVFSAARNYIYYTDVFDAASTQLDDETIRLPSVEKITECFPLGLEDAIERLTPPKHADKIPAIIEIARETPRHKDLLTYPRNLGTAMKGLHHTHKIGIVTNATHDSVDELYEGSPGIEKEIDVVVTDAKKPGPDGVNEALETLSADRDFAALAGDTPETDGVAAEQAGIKFIFVNKFSTEKERASERQEGRIIVADLYDLYLTLNGLKEAVQRYKR
jgi:phosphoglycolate phosphatase-like HAD superfamily hydrolase